MIIVKPISFTAEVLLKLRHLHYTYENNTNKIEISLTLSHGGQTIHISLGDTRFVYSSPK